MYIKPSPGKIPETMCYKHVQFAKVLLLMLGLPFLVCLGIALSTPSMQYTLFSVSVLLGTGAGLFSSMTIQVSDRFLHWKFGPGLIAKKVAVAQIRSIEPTRTSWLEGWGIHYTARGWLYNVSGFNALQVTLKDGKRFLLGTNDTEGLLLALKSQLKQ